MLSQDRTNHGVASIDFVNRSFLAMRTSLDHVGRQLVFVISLTQCFCQRRIGKQMRIQCHELLPLADHSLVLSASEARMGHEPARQAPVEATALARPHGHHLLAAKPRHHCLVRQFHAVGAQGVEALAREWTAVLCDVRRYDLREVSAGQGMQHA